jgi:heptosyltransferase-1
MKIAILKLSALGDIIHTAFVLQFIKAKVPHAQIDWIVEAGFAQILEHNPDIHAIKTVNLKSIKKQKSQLFSEIKKIKSYAKENYDIVIDLQGLLKSAITAKLLGKRIAGFDKNSTREGIAALLYHDRYPIAYDENTIDRYRLLISQALDIPLSKEEVLHKAPYLHYHDKDFTTAKPYFLKDKANIIFIIGANWQSRIYPKEQLLEVAQELNANILIPYASESEKEMGAWLEEKAEHITLLPKMNLNALKATISHADLLIGNDTGPSYIAWANNIPSIILFGPTPPSRIYESAISVTLKSSSPINHYKLNKEDFSIKEITADSIVTAAKRLLGLS